MNVDLDFFGFIESDYQALKNLLIQLFAHDAKDLDVPGLAADLVEGEDNTTGDVGTGVKADGQESDPLAFIGVLPWSAVSLQHAVCSDRAAKTKSGDSSLCNTYAGQTAHKSIARIHAEEDSK